MKKIFIFLFVIFSINSHPLLAQQNVKTFVQDSKQIQNTNTYSKHWFGTLPFVKNTQQSLLIHDIFILSFDLEKKLPSWVAYQLSPTLVWGELKEQRKYIPDPFLSPKKSLTVKDYKGASTCDGKKKIGYDKGHLSPLASFKASIYAYQTQYLSNIVPQKRNLNQGPWKKLEEKIRNFVKKGNIVRVLTGPLYGKPGKDKVPPCWKSAQGKLQEVPSAYWKVLAFKYKSKIKTCAFLMPQNIKNKKTESEKISSAF